MLKELIEQTTTYSVQKIIKQSMNENLKIKNLDFEVQREVNKDKKYLLYMHIPFCHTFCPYCSFHKFKYEENSAKEYFKYLRLEMKKLKSEGLSFHTLYVGGGTTLINEEELVKTLELAKKLFNVKEISCESDPNHISYDSLKRFTGLIDRLSIGIQSFNDNILKAIYRYDKFGSSQILQEKISSIAGVLPHISLDLIFNFPTQTKEILLNDLTIAKSLNVEQITTYPLMSTDLTQKSMSKAFKGEKNSNEYKFYKIICNEFKEYHQNNAWSFSKNKSSMSDEYVSQHSEYIGIGSGAFSHLKNKLYVNAYNLEEYALLINKRTHTVIASSQFSSKKLIQYHFLTWLFEGSVDIKKFDIAFNTSLKKELVSELYMLKKTNSILIKNDKIYTTKFGKYLSLVMMKEFYSGMDKIRAIFKQKIPLEVA